MSLNVIRENPLLTKTETAKMVKEARLKKLLTQKALAEKAGISLRSLQRIENAEVWPRTYTWHQLAAHIDLTLFSSIETDEPINVEPLKINTTTTGKWIMSFSSMAVIVLSFTAYVLQSPTFPETQFEMCLMLLAGCIIYAIILYRVWK